MSSFDKANDAAPSAGDRPKPEDLIDHLLIVRVNEHRPNNPMGITRDRDGESVPADCIFADVVDLDNPDQPVYYDYIFLQAKLIAHFKANVGNTLIGDLRKHPDAGQRKGAYYFQDQAHVMRQAAVGEAWINGHPEFFGSQAPGSSSRQTRNTQPQNTDTQARDHGQHSGSGGNDAWDNVHRTQSTLEQMRRTNNNNSNFDDEKVPF